MPSNSRRDREQELGNPPRRAVASRGEARRSAARKAPDNGAKPGDSQSLEIGLRIAQNEAYAQAAYTLAEEALKILLHMGGTLSRHMRFQGGDQRAEANIDDQMKSATYALARWRERIDAKIASLIEEDRTKRGGR